jgi:hypothetical protein
MIWKTLMMGAGLAALIAGGAVAQDTNEDTTATTEGTAATETEGMATGDTGENGDMAVAPSFSSLEEMTVGDMVGMSAYDPEGNRIAEIDYVVDGAGGASAVLGIGGFLGLGEYTVALPLEDFELGPEGNSLVLDTDKETLKQEPEFDETGVEGLPPETRIADLLPEEESEEDTEGGADAGASDDGADAGAEADTSMDSSGETGDTEMDAEADAEAGAEVETDTDATTETEEETTQ